MCGILLARESETSALVKNMVFLQRPGASCRWEEYPEGAVATITFPGALLISPAFHVEHEALATLLMLVLCNDLAGIDVIQLKLGGISDVAVRFWSANGMEGVKQLRALLRGSGVENMQLAERRLEQRLFADSKTKKTPRFGGGKYRGGSMSRR